MAPRRETMFEHVADSIRFAVRDNWNVAVVLLGLTTICVAIGFWMHRDTDQPTAVEEGQVISFGSYSDYDGNHPTVLVKLDDGSVRQLAASPRSLRSCRAGARIRIVRSANSLKVSPQGCPSTNP